MSALDKLNAKAKKVNTEVNTIKPKKAVEEKKEEIKVITQEEASNVPDKPEKKKKHPGGRKSTRGKKDIDYKMMNIAIPMDVYEKLQAASNGNMTYFINQILKNSVDL